MISIVISINRYALSHKNLSVLKFGYTCMSLTSIIVTCVNYKVEEYVGECNDNETMLDLCQ